MQNFWLKLIISGGALVFVTARFIWPEIKIDTITIGLLLVAVLSWLTSIIESAKFPGGWEIKFRDVQEAGNKITTGTSVQSSEPLLPRHSYLKIPDQDPNLALVGLRIEIENRLRALAEKHQVKGQQSLSRLFQELMKQRVLNDASLSGIQELIMAGNQAAHGAKVEDRVADWAFDYGPQILAALDSKLENELKTD